MAAAGAMPDATCTSACANMRWAPSSTALAAHGGFIPVWFDLSDLLRLHAPGDPAGGTDGAARRACVHARQHRRRRGRAHASAGGTTGEPARDSESHRDPPRRRQRNRGRLARRAGNARAAGAAGVDPAGSAHARSQPLRRGGWIAPWRLCVERCDRAASQN